MSPKRRTTVSLSLAVAAGIVAGCAGVREPTASGPPPVTVATRAAYTQADVDFMRGMIQHHGQALDMAALVPARTAWEDLRILAARIDATQRDEIRRMGEWLEARGETVPSPESYREHAAHGIRMAGMLTAEQMQQLAAASGPAFDRLFLEYMIQHHEGALTMVSELQQAGGGVEGQMYLLTSDIDADQRAEIARMQSMLTVLQRGSE